MESNASSSETDWAAIRAEIPQFESGDTAIHRFGSEVSGNALPPEVRDALARTVNAVPLDGPPCYAEWMLGPRDAEWLAVFARKFESERDAEIAHRLMARPGTVPGDHRTDVEQEIAPRYRAFLTEIARERFTADETMQARFLDGRRLHELEEGSPHRAWLEMVIGRTASGHMWTHHPDLVSEQDLRYLAATDVGELVRLRLEGFELLARDRREKRSTPPEQLFEPLARQFLRLVEGRRTE